MILFCLHTINKRAALEVQIKEYAFNYIIINNNVHFFDALILIGCDGSFGNNCTHLCPTNCRGTLCDANTGQCFGCVPGYEGQLCTQGLFTTCMPQKDSGRYWIIYHFSRLINFFILIPRIINTKTFIWHKNIRLFISIFPHLNELSSRFIFILFKDVQHYIIYIHYMK